MCVFGIMQLTKLGDVCTWLFFFILLWILRIFHKNKCKINLSLLTLFLFGLIKQLNIFLSVVSFPLGMPHNWHWIFLSNYANQSTVPSLNFTLPHTTFLFITISFLPIIKETQMNLFSIHSDGCHNRCTLDKQSCQI